MAKFKLRKKVSKINLRIISKPHAHLQSMIEDICKVERIGNKTVGGVAHRVPIGGRKEEGRTDGMTESQKHVPRFSSKRWGTIKYMLKHAVIFSL